VAKTDIEIEAEAIVRIESDRAGTGSTTGAGMNNKSDPRDNANEVTGTGVKTNEGSILNHRSYTDAKSSKASDNGASAEERSDTGTRSREEFNKDASPKEENITDARPSKESDTDASQREESYTYASSSEEFDKDPSPSAGSNKDASPSEVSDKEASPSKEFEKKTLTRGRNLILVQVRLKNLTKTLFFLFKRNKRQKT